MTDPLLPPADVPADVLAEPLANAPRRRHAEALRVDHPDRARFILSQLRRLHAERTGQDPAAVTGAHEVEDLLLRRHEPRWLAHLPQDGLRWSWSRGYPEGVAMDAAAFLARGADLFARTPLLHAALFDPGPVLAALLASPLLGRLRSLDLKQAGLDDAAAQAIAACSAFENIDWLDLSGNRISEKGLDALAGSPHLRGLRWLGLANNPVPDPSPRLAEDWSGPVGVEQTGQGRALQQRHGPRPWLKRLPYLNPYPPPAWVYPYTDALDPTATTG